MLVFVYGTLTDPDQIASLLGDGPGKYEFVGQATLEGLHRVDGRYPTLVPGGRVEGRLLDVNDPALERLDRYEGVDRELYVRVQIPLSDGHSVWVYVGDPERLDVDTDAAWTDAQSLRESIRTQIMRDDIVIYRNE